MCKFNPSLCKYNASLCKFLHASPEYYMCKFNPASPEYSMCKFNPASPEPRMCKFNPSLCKFGSEPAVAGHHMFAYTPGGRPFGVLPVG